MKFLYYGKRTNRASGFTIIEVMIVLAIAGLILLIVFLAVPALQRNGRNTERKRDAASLSNGISEYLQNHANTLPTVDSPSTYASVACTPTYIADCPFLSGINFSYYTDSEVNFGYTPPGLTPGATAKYIETDPDTLYIENDMQCNNNGTGAQTYAANYLSMVVLYAVETGGTSASGCVEIAGA